MTIVFTSASSNLIIMTVDSAVTLDFEDSHREYETGRKSYVYPGVGCVATWGARDGNQIGIFLNKQNISSDNLSVNGLTDLVYRYLTEEYRPHEFNLDDVGYHIAGFDQKGNAHLSHVFWGFDRPKPAEQTHQKYERYDHSPSANGTIFLYNGRNDLADVMVRTLINQIAAGNTTHFNLGTPVGLVRLGDFVMRFASELTPEVGLPLFTYLISPSNQVERIRNDTFCPLSDDEILSKLTSLGNP